MRHLRWLVALVLGCGGSNATSTDAGAEAGAQASADAGAEAEADAQAVADAGSPNPALSNLPVGDNKYLAYPQVGHIFSCQQSFGGMGGASKDGPWIKGDGTFDFNAKVVVSGSVSWPAHAFDMSVSGSTRTITGNDLPTHTTGTYPIAKTDPAYQYDQNPNTIKAQTLSWALPKAPTIASVQTCLGGGPIGILLTGSVFFDALDGEGRDAVAHETQDACQAHPEPTGMYHYHSVTTCIADPGTGHSALLGYARDGFGIYGVRGENGVTLTNADLDECHGHTHAITWDGVTTTLYHYHQTYEFPYTLGCYKGTPIN